MLHDPSGRRIVPGLDGWYGVALIPASDAAGVTGLEEIAALVAAGAMTPDTPVFHATKRTDAPWPDVLVGVPLEVADLHAWQRGDRTVARDVVEALETAYQDFMRRATSGKLN